MTGISPAPTARDIQLAAALMQHHRAGDSAGIVEIVNEVDDSDRATQLVVAILQLHHLFIVETRTSTGVEYLATYVNNIGSIEPTNDDTTDLQRAAHLLDAHGRTDAPGMNSVFKAASKDGRCTSLIVTLLNLYDRVIPELSSTAGSAWLDATITTAAAKDGDTE